MRRHLLWLIIGCMVSLSSYAGDNLLSLYQRALLASPELKGSQYTLDIIRAQEDQAFGKLLPQAALSANYSGNELNRKSPNLPANWQGYPGKRAGLNIRQPLFDLQAYLLMKSQQSRTAQGEEDLVAAHQQLIYDLVERYVDALEAADKSEIISTELSSTEKQLARVKSMNERQMALVTDLYELQARVETLRTGLIDSQNDAKVALEKLRELTGDAVTNVQPVRLDTTQPPPDGSVDSWVDQVNRNNPDIAGLKHAVESADRSISAYEAGHLPRVELQAGANYSDTSFNNQQSPPYAIGNIGVQADIPLYEGGITSARVREAESRKGLSTSQLDQKLREIEKLTRAAYLDMSTSSARSLATDRQLEANEKAKLAMEKGYELGVVTIVDLLNAQKQLSEARKAQREARYRYFKARSTLLRQSGRLDVEELAKLNDWLVAENPFGAADTKPANSTAAVKSTAPVTKPVTSSPADKTIAKPISTDVKPTSKPAISFAAKPVDNATIKPTVVISPDQKPIDKPTISVSSEVKADNKTAVESGEDLDIKPVDHSVVNAKVNKFVHADFKPVIKSVENPYKSSNKPVTNPQK
jgi:outer membrane protein